MHTTGPWNYRLIPPDSRDPYRKHWVDTANGSPIADIFNTGEHAVADAKLIAAAPELLEALEQLIDRHDSTPSMLTADDWQKARLAVKKATL